MKGLVTEIRDGKAAVLREDGVFVSVRKNCKVGDTIEVPSDPLRFPVKRMAAAAAALVIMLGAGGYSYMNVQACSYVSLDVNPSVEYVLNRKDLVISAEGLNEEGKALVEELEALGIKGDTLSEVLEKTESLLPENSGDSEDYVLLNVTSDSDDHADRLSAEAKGVFEKEKKPHRVVACSRASRRSRKHARELGISTGRYEEMLGLESDLAEFENQVPRYRDMELEELFSISGRIVETPEDPADLIDHEEHGENTHSFSNGYDAGANADGTDSHGDDGGHDSDLSSGNDRGDAHENGAVQPENGHGDSHGDPAGNSGNAGSDVDSNKRGSDNRDSGNGSGDRGSSGQTAPGRQTATPSTSSQGGAPDGTSQGNPPAGNSTPAGNPAPGNTEVQPPENSFVNPQDPSGSGAMGQGAPGSPDGSGQIGSEPGNGGQGDSHDNGDFSGNPGGGGGQDGGGDHGDSSSQGGGHDDGGHEGGNDGGGDHGGPGGGPGGPPR